MKLSKMFVLAAGVLFLGTGLFAQDEVELPRSEDVTLTKSKPYDVVDAASKMYFSDYNGGVLAIKVTGRGKNEFVFQKFEGDNLNEKSKKTEIVEIRGFNFEYIAEINKKLYLLYSVYDKPNKSEQLFAREIDMNGGGFVGSETLLVKTDKKLVGSYYVGYSAQGKFSLDISDDENTFIIRYRYPPLSRNDSENYDVIGVSVFGADLDKKWEADLKMPYTEALMDNLDFTIGSNGNAYFLIRKYKEEVRRGNSNDPDNQSMAILIADADGDIAETEFKLKDDFLIDDVILKENSKKDIVCAGYYRKSNSASVDGAFMIAIDKSGDLGEGQYYEFTADFIKQYRNLSARAEKKMDKKEQEDGLSFTNLRMRKIRLMDDGGVVLAGEIYYVTTYTDSKGNTHYVYHYNDVILTKINANGELAWMKKLPKRSTTESFRIMGSKDNIYVLFSDNPLNAKLSDDENPHQARGSERQVIAYELNGETGDKTYMPLFGYREIDGTPVYQYSLNRVTALSENSFAVEMYIKGKQDMMFKVTFDK